MLGVVLAEKTKPLAVSGGVIWPRCGLFRAVGLGSLGYRCLYRGYVGGSRGSGVGLGRVLQNSLTTVKVVALLLFAAAGFVAVGASGGGAFPMSAPVRATSWLFALVPVIARLGRPPAGGERKEGGS